MAATLKLAHKAIGVEVRRGTYDVVLDGESVGSVEMNDTFAGSKGAAGGSVPESGGKSSGPAGAGAAPGGETPMSGGEAAGCPAEATRDALGRSGGSLRIPAGCTIVLAQPIVVDAGVSLELVGEGPPGTVGAGLNGEGQTQLMLIRPGASVTLKDLSLFRGHASGAAGMAGEDGLGGYASEAMSEGGDGAEGAPPGVRGLPGEPGQEGKAGQPGHAGPEEGPSVYIAP